MVHLEKFFLLWVLESLYFSPENVSLEGVEMIHFVFVILEGTGPFPLFL